jgi:hypothetical protein
LPKTLHEQLKKLAKHEGISVDQLIASAVGEKLTALMTEDYIEKRSNRYDEKKYSEAINAISNREPEDFDKL